MDAQTLLREQAWLYALALSLVSRTDVAEDVVQETWLAALERPPAGRERPQIRAFLATVARRVVGAWHRGETLRAARERAAGRPEAVAPERDALAWLALQRRLAEAIAELREPYRTAIVMRFVEGLAPGEIARRRRETPEAVRTRLSRGLELLRKRLDRESGGEREAWLPALGGLVLRRGPDPTTLTSTLIGATMGWKSFVAASVLTLGIAGWWSRSGSEDTVPEARLRPATSEESLSESTEEGAGGLATPERLAVAERSPARPELATRPALRGRIVSLREGRPLGGAHVSLRRATPELTDTTGQVLRELEASAQRGAQVREAELRAGPRTPSPQELIDESGASLAVTADADGRFAFETIPGGELALLASAERHVATLLPALAHDGEREIELALAPAGSLEVEVVDEAGAPLAGVGLAVTITGALERGSPCFGTRDEGFGPSGPDGRVRIEGVPCGLELGVEPWPVRRRAPETRAARTTIDPAALRGLVRLVVASTGALTGVVHALPEPCRIEARFRSRLAATSAFRAPLQPDGRFLLERLPLGPGDLEIAVIRTGSRATTAIGARCDAVVVPGDVTDLGELELIASARVAGHVPDWNGNSGDYFVSLRFLRAGEPHAETTIDDEGRFEAWLPPGPCTIEVAHHERVLGLVTARAPEDDLVLDLLEFCAGLRGELPESERALAVFFPLLQRTDDSGAAQRVSSRPLHGPLRIVEGEFATLSLAPGGYSLLAPFGVRGAAWIPRLDLQQGRVEDLGRLECGFGAVRGRVVDARGAPVGGAEVVVASPYDAALNSHAQRLARTSDDGGFEVQALPAGPWRVRALRGDALGSSELLDVLPGETVQADVVVRGSARLSLRVAWDGEPVADALFALEHEEGLDRIERRSSDEGRAELGELAPGEWSWSLDEPTPARAGRITLRAGEHRELDLELRRNPVRLRLVAPGRTGTLVEARAWSLDPDRRGETCGSTQHGPDWFELDLPPGRSLVSARTTDGEQHLGIVDVLADVHTLDFVPSELSLHVRGDTDAHPPAAALLSVDGVPVGRGIPLTLERVEGGWRCASLPAGATVLLDGAAPRTGPLQREIQVRASGETEVDWP